MAFNQATEWDVRDTGDNLNGGGWYDSGGSSTDYSQQNVAELTVADAVANGTTTVTSATGGFTAAMEGNIVNIETKGRFQIVTVSDTNTIVVDANVAAGSGLDAYAGGAVAHPEEICTIVLAGNIIHVKAATYAAGGNIFWNTIATNVLEVSIQGFNSSHGDVPRGDNRPLFTQGVNRHMIKNYYRFENIRMQGEYTYVLESVADYAVVRNCKFEQVFNGAGRYCLQLDAYMSVDDCEFTESGGGTSIGMGGANSYMKVSNCHFHDLDKGTVISANGMNFYKNYFSDCTSWGLGLTGLGNTYDHNGFDGNGTGLQITDIGSRVLNNQFTHNTTGLDWGATARPSNFIDGNNWHGNGTDRVNCSAGPNATTDDPGYADPDAEDFSDVDDASGITMQLGVGIGL